MRDKEKTATSEGGETTQLASGLAFAEFSEHKYAMHVVNYLNNIQLNNSRNLIVDFALDDARKVRLRQQRMDKQKEATKKNQANQKKAIIDAKKEDSIPEVIELGNNIYK